MVGKLQKFIEDKKNQTNKDTSNKSNYGFSDQILSSIVESMMGKIKTLRGEDGKNGKDGKTPTMEEILSILQPYIENLQSRIEEELSKNKLLKIIQPLIPNVTNGKDGKNGKDATIDYDLIIDKILSEIPKPQNGKDATLPNLYRLAINTINVIESLKGEERIDVKAIKGLEKFIEVIASKFYERGVGYGGPGEIFHDLTLGGNGTASAPLYVIGGGGTTIEIPSGVIDGVNTIFTVTSIPKYIVLNGVTYFENDGYTRSELIITMLVVPVVGSTLRSAY